MKTLIISNLGFNDVTFDSDRGSWNVTRAMRDCAAGKHGEPFLVPVKDLFEANGLVEVEEAKIASMVADPERLAQSPPLISVMEDGKAWLIEGHHRVHALHRLGVEDAATFVIAEENAKPYRVYYNGNRIAPWMKQESAA